MIQWWQRLRNFYRSDRGKRRIIIASTIVSLVAVSAVLGPSLALLPAILGLLVIGVFSYWMID